MAFKVAKRLNNVMGDDAKADETVTRTLADKRQQLCQLSEMMLQIGFYEEMCDFTTQLANLKMPMTLRERNLLVMSHKKVVEKCRLARRNVLSAVANENGEVPSPDEISPSTKIIQDYLFNYVLMYCGDMIKLCKEKSLWENDSGHLFFQKSRADFYRYLSEFAYTKHDFDRYTRKALKYYKQADTLAQETLHKADPVRLGIVVNFTKFMAENCSRTDEAIRIASETFNEAMSAVLGLDPRQKEDSTRILSIIKNNVVLWTLESRDAEPKQKRWRKRTKKGRTDI